VGNESLISADVDCKFIGFAHLSTSRFNLNIPAPRRVEHKTRKIPVDPELKRANIMTQSGYENHETSLRSGRFIVLVLRAPATTLHVDLNCVNAMPSQTHRFTASMDIQGR
jgi:hypothetical protein